jgi:putative transposase
MSRMPRFFVPGSPLHVVTRGNNRSAIFHEDADRTFYRGYLQHVTCSYGVAVHAYVLMSNHVHLLATPATNDALPKAMHAANLVYARYFNDKYARTGTIWEGRYKAAIVDSDAYLLLCMRYIELNPVRAEMVEGPAEYPWSSFSANACGGRDPLVTPHALYQSLGRKVEERCDAYRAAIGVPLDEGDVVRLRDATQHGWAMGRPAFCDRVDAATRRARRLKRRTP